MRPLLLLLALLLPLSGQARVEAYYFDNPEQEARYKQLIDELRCLVCQNQNLADSNAELAQDMRQLTYEMVRDGASNEEVVTFMVQRYGDFVMYRPPFKSTTAMLWVGPFIILGGALLVLLLIIRRKRAETAPEFNQEELRRAERLLDQQEKES